MRTILQILNEYNESGVLLEDKLEQGLILSALIRIEAGMFVLSKGNPFVAILACEKGMERYDQKHKTEKSGGDSNEVQGPNGWEGR
jgi:hypothetical protein